MANAERGEVELKAGDKTYTLRLGWNEIAELESLLDVDFFADFAPKFTQPTTIRAGEWRAMLWASLREHHKDVDLVAVGEIMNQVGFNNLAPVLTKTFRLVFPDDQVDENPQKASASAGTKP